MPNSDAFLHVETASHGGAFGNNPIPTPTEAQRLAGNYKKGRVSLHGLSIAIEQPRGTYRTGIDAKTGKRWTNRMAAHYGYFERTKGADGDGVDCFVGFYPQSETAYVINQYVGGRFDEAKVMLAFPDEDSARRAYRDSYDRGWPGLESIIPVSISQLKWWLKHGDMRRPLRAENLPYAGLETMTKNVQWNSDALPEDQTIDQVLYDIRRADGSERLLLDSVSLQDILEDSDGVIAFDALVIPFARLENKMEALNKAMERAGSTVKPAAMQVTEPFNQRGVANVAAIFELSDGQSVSIFFHNPDVTPKKMASTDELISWKWLLNKKDITIVVAPERGEDLNVREVVRRIMKLADKNSAAFIRANGKRAERMAAIGGLKDEITGLEAEFKQVQGELEVAKIEAEGRKAKAAEVQKKSPIEFLSDPPHLNYRVSKTAQNSVRIMPAVGKKFIEEEINSLKKWVSDAGFSVYSKGTYLQVIGDDAPDIPDGLEEKRLERVIAKEKARDDEKTSAELSRAEEYAALPSSKWIENNLGSDFAGEYNKLMLARFLDKKDKFKGMTSRGWADPLTRLGFDASGEYLVQDALDFLKEKYVSNASSGAAETDPAPVAAPENQKFYVQKFDDRYRVTSAKNGNPISPSYPTDEEATAAKLQYVNSGEFPKPSDALEAKADPAPVAVADPVTPTDSDQSKYDKKIKEWDERLAKVGSEKTLERAINAVAGGIIGREFGESSESFYARDVQARATRDWLYEKQGKIAAIDRSGVSENDAADPVQGPLPWDGASANDETRWFGTTVRLTALTRKLGAIGLVREGDAVLYNVINGGGALAVKWPNLESTVRVTVRGQYIVEVLELVDSKAVAKPANEKTPEPTPEPTATRNRPSPGQYVQPKNNASREGQIALADRGGRIATLIMLNNAVGNPYSDSEINNVANDRIDDVGDYLNEIGMANKVADPVTPADTSASGDGGNIPPVNPPVATGGDEPPSVATEDPQKVADRALFQSVIDATNPDMIEPSLADKLEAAYNRYIGDAEMEALFEAAVNSYMEAGLAASANL
ncbi:hypothetical protein [Propionivibrio sp.]|uniref:defense against restriction DarA-related protein n=1 Tax=Propionivibrio sp. TaxID=2212460 RepID=UPI003BF37FD1